jgi:Uma2 family endonuclease
MSIASENRIETCADLHRRLGGVPLDRILMRPPPGTATEADLLSVNARKETLCELVDGVLVEKALGVRKAVLGAAVLCRLMEHVEARDLGIVTGANCPMRILPGQVRLPDVAYCSWDRFPSKAIPKEPIPALVPDLAVHVLTPVLTKAEIARKIRDFIKAGTRLLWFFDLDRKAVRVYEPPDLERIHTEGECLDGGKVLTDLRIEIAPLFARIAPLTFKNRPT